MQKTSFRWPKLWHEICLLKEVVDTRPGKPEQWETVAETLTSVFGVPVKGRGCREHLDLMIKKFKQEERKALKR